MHAQAMVLFALFLGDPYSDELLQHRAEIDRAFADPSSSPLATFAIWLLDKEESLIGTAAQADIRIEDDSLRPRHARVVSRSEGGAEVEAAHRVEALDGPVRTYPEDRLVTAGEWKAGDRLRLGRFLFLLNQHPAGPVVRAIDPQAEAVQRFRGLDYFPPAPEFRVSARIEWRNPERIRTLDTQGWPRHAWIFGKVRFRLLGQDQSLNLISFQPEPKPGPSAFMLVFKDETSRKESYPACRYLYVAYTREDETQLDFNRSFNPYCAYADGFACPLPLPGDSLSVAVRAGERKYQAH